MRSAIHYTRCGKTTERYVIMSLSEEEYDFMYSVQHQIRKEFKKKIENITGVKELSEKVVIIKRNKTLHLGDFLVPMRAIINEMKKYSPAAETGELPMTNRHILVGR